MLWCNVVARASSDNNRKLGRALRKPTTNTREDDMARKRDNKRDKRQHNNPEDDKALIHRFLRLRNPLFFDED